MSKFKIIFSVVLKIFFIIFVSPVTYGSRKLVIDTDAGSDDALAILLTLFAWAHNTSNFEVIAITCVSGNTEERIVEKNVLKVLTVANVSNIPVYAGAQKPLMQQQIVFDDFFGKDGFGDFIFTDDINIEVDNSTHAAFALVNLAKQYSGELHILAIGPLTNIAIAMALDPNFLNNVNQLYIMGGSVAGLGNKAPGVEYNFGCDPDSAFIVLNSTVKKPSILYPWETAERAAIPTKWRIKELGSINSAIIQFLNKAEHTSIIKSSPHWISADGMAAAIMIWPELVKKSLITNIAPVIDGSARGALLIDYINTSRKAKNAEIVQEFDARKFKSLLISHLS